MSPKEKLKRDRLADCEADVSVHGNAGPLIRSGYRRGYDQAFADLSRENEILRTALKAIANIQNCEWADRIHTAKGMANEALKPVEEERNK